MLNLTAQQIKVFDVIKESVQSNGYPPTRAEIAKILEFKSVNAAESHIKALVKKGVIEKVPGSSRGIKLVEEISFSGFERSIGSFIFAIVIATIVHNYFLQPFV